MVSKGERFVRALMGSSLQTGALRAVLLLAGFTLAGALVSWALLD